MTERTTDRRRELLDAAVPRLRAQGVPRVARRRHRRGGGRRARAPLPLLPLEGRGARDDLPLDVGEASSSTRSGSKVRDAAARAASALLSHLSRLVARLAARLDLRARAGDRSQPRGRGARRRDQGGVPRAGCGRSARRRSAARCVPIASLRSRRGSSMARSRRSSRVGCSGSCPARRRTSSARSRRSSTWRMRGSRRDLQPARLRPGGECTRARRAPLPARDARPGGGRRAHGLQRVRAAARRDGVGLPLRAEPRGVADRRRAARSSCERRAARKHCAPAT